MSDSRVGSSFIRDRLEAERQDLLDLSLNNTLLNHRELKSRGVRVVDERAEHVFRILVEEEKAMSFLPAPEDSVGDGDSGEESAEAEGVGGGAVESGEDPEESRLVFEQPPAETTEAEPAARHVDLKLQTAYSDKNLQRRLLNTFYFARTHIQERGVNTLYLALGELRWYEDRGSDQERRAPLVLVPVELDRANVKSRFRIAYNGADFGANHSLEVKLALDYSVDLPEFSVEQGAALSTYFDAVARSCETLDRWSVDPHAIHLGFYSFLKLLMYEDLNPENWPEDQKPYDDPLLGRLMSHGFGDGGLTVDKEAPLDPLYDPAASFQVVDADSSQTAAIENVLAGSDLIIEGPPGTGKSQTISNLIAEAVGRGKTVLFVAEKLAALDVVHRRLESIGLGDLCLELHGHRTRKREVLRELERTLNLTEPTGVDRELPVSTVRDTRSTLNAYAHAVNQPIGESGVSPIEAYGHLDRIQVGEEGVLEKIATPRLVEWSREDFAGVLAKVRQLEGLLERMGTPRRHPFWGARIDAYLPTLHDAQIRSVARDLGDLVDRLAATCEGLADALSIAPPDNLPAVDDLIHYAETVLASPRLDRVAVDAADWSAEAERVSRAVGLGETILETRRQHDQLLPHAWDEARLLPVRNAIAVYGSKWWRLLKGEYRQARKRLAILWDGAVPPEVEEQLAALDAILAVHRSRAELEDLRGLLESLYGGVPREESDDWRSFREVFDYLHGVHREIARRSLPAQALDILSQGLDRESLGARLEEARTLRAEVDSHLRQARQVLAIPEPSKVEESLLAGMRFQDLLDRLIAWKEEPGRLQQMATFNVLSAALAQDSLQGLVRYASNREGQEPSLEDLLLFARYTLLVEKALQERLALRAFEGSTHDTTVTRFREADQELLQANRFAVLEEHHRNLPAKAGVGQIGALLHEMQKRTRHKSIRQLMQLSGRAIQAIKPVFMMSPLSIAAYIPPGSVTFDLVVFDEASQVRPVDAFGALLRGRQAVVVGDSQQLPPTTFFSRMTDGEAVDELEQSTAELESVLKAFAAKGAPSVMLQWHYRSRHESLIQLSNQEFYEGDLKIFPSPDAHREGQGLVFHHLPETHYQAGKGRSYNRGEAKAVARAVMDHARHRPDLTLGVAAFSKSQSDVILDELEALRRDDSSLEDFFSRHPEEPFFVKNLENVQGDERDIILISVGYGRTEDGRLSMNFGPLNHVGGERRLNVLVTRARHRCEVFSNLTAQDIDLRKTQARGVEAFKKYLRFAEVGVLEEVAARAPYREPVFETQVARALRAEGYEVRQGIGSAGFQVDLAIVDPGRPGRYLLGIECDGEGYRDARWARDRDRIRPAVLHGLGWSIHRVWSTDWFRNKAAEVRAILAAIERAKDLVLPLTDSESDEFAVTRAAQPVETSSPSPSGLAFAPYEEATLRISLGGRPLHRIAASQMIDWVGQVVASEGPIHQTEVGRRIARAAGKQQTGSRIQGAVDAGISKAEGEGRVRRDPEGFVWPGGMVDPTPRDRSRLPDASRKFDLISDREVQVAVLQVVAEAFGADRDEIAPAVCRAFGFARTSSAMASRVEEVIEALVAAGELLAEGRSLRISD